MDVVEGAGCKAKRMVLQCINGVGSNPVEGCQDTVFLSGAPEFTPVVSGVRSTRYLFFCVLFRRS
jgi:hypothetical protein